MLNKKNIVGYAIYVIPSITGQTNRTRKEYNAQHIGPSPNVKTSA